MRGTKARGLRVVVLLSLLPALAGVALARWAPAEFLERTGLDFLFVLRGPRAAPPEVCVVGIDEISRSELGVTGPRWPRGLHAQLVRVLAREGARVVAFDVVFDAPGDPEEDQHFEEALREAGNVVLGATVERVPDPRFIQMQRIDPYEFFAAAAAAVGQVPLPLDRDGVVRSTWTVHEDRPALALAAYEVATGAVGRRETGIRLINFYGPPRTVPTLSAYQALDPAQYLPAGFFRDKLVFVGLAEPAAAGPAPKDAFLTPYRGAGGEPTYGVEIHATVAANLLEGRRVRTAPVALEVAFLIVLPLVAMTLFLRTGPFIGALALVVSMVLPWVAAHLAFSRGSVWLPTMVPSFIQLPLTYLASVLWYYLTTVRDRERIRRAFSFYLSPAMIGRIAQDPDSLSLGGEEIVGTALMTDIQGFTTLAENLPPVQTVAMLNHYFSDVTRHIFDTGGTLIKFIGDAVFAIWNAPLRQDDHATRGCVAALALVRLQSQSGSGPRLVTRIGVHTGPMVVGNLGSSQRFDYTAIGDAVNLAARLEGLNKQLGTLAVISAATLRAAGGSFVTRDLGRVRVVGRVEPVAIHELVGEVNGPPLLADSVRESFALGLAHFTAREFRQAAEQFRAARELRGGKDGPSELYLGLAERFLLAPPPPDWDGVVVFESK